MRKCITTVSSIVSNGGNCRICKPCNIIDKYVIDVSNRFLYTEMLQLVKNANISQMSSVSYSLGLPAFYLENLNT